MGGYGLTSQQLNTQTRLRKVIACTLTKASKFVHNAGPIFINPSSLIIRLGSPPIVMIPHISPREKHSHINKQGFIHMGSTFEKWSTRAPRTPAIPAAISPQEPVVGCLVRAFSKRRLLSKLRPVRFVGVVSEGKLAQVAFEFRSCLFGRVPFLVVSKGTQRETTQNRSTPNKRRTRVEPEKDSQFQDSRACLPCFLAGCIPELNSGKYWHDLEQ